MANVIRYKRDQPTKRGLKKGNTVVGTGEENYGPTSTTGYVAGIDPPEGGYVVYTLSGENDPAIYVANSGDDLINIANTLGGEVDTKTAALKYLNNAFNVWVISSLPNNIITDGLKLHLDASNETSFPDNEPTINYLAHNNAVAQSSYQSYSATSNGTWDLKHPNAIRAYNIDGGQITGYINTGVSNWENTYHAHWQYDSELGRPVTVMQALDSNWKAKNFGASMGAWASLGMSAGDKYTISWLQWTSDLNLCADAGFYSKNTSNSNGFHDGRSYGNTKNTILNTWQRVSYTFTVNAVRDLSNSYGSIYMYGHTTSNNGGTLKIADVQLELKDHATPYTGVTAGTGGITTRIQNSIWKDISGGKKPLSELRVLGAHHSGYQYPPFYNFFNTNCQMTNEPVVNDLPNNWPVSTVVEDFDLVIADEYVWAMGGAVIEWMKDLVDAGVSCIGVGNDQRGTIFVSGYNSSTRQSHDIRMDSKSRIGLQDRIFSYGSGDVYGGITELQNGAKPIYYRDDVNRITGYVYDNEDTGASFWFDQEGLQSTSTELFEAGLDYVTRNIGVKGLLKNDPTFNSKGWFTFDGTDDYVQLEDLFLTGSFSVEAIIYPKAASTYHVFFRKGDDSTSNSNMDWSMGYDYNQFHVRASNASVTVNEYQGSSFVNNWGYVVLTYNGSSIKMYQNGNEVFSKTVTLANNYNNYSIGRGINNYANLDISKIRAYNRTLSDNEISQNYYGGNIVTDSLVFATDPGALVSYDKSGTTMYSLTGSHSGTINNAVYYSSSYGGYFSYDGADDYIEFPDSNDFTFSDAVATWEAWVRPTGNAGVLEHTIMTKANYSYNTREYQFQVRYSSGTYYFYLGQQNNNASWKPIGSTSTSAININQWYHILVTSDGNGNAQMYINNELRDTSTGWHTTQANLGAPLCIGATINATNPIQEFVGDISICRLYKKHFSSSDVAQNFNAHKAKFGL